MNYGKLVAVLSGAFGFVRAQRNGVTGGVEFWVDGKPSSGAMIDPTAWPMVVPSVLSSPPTVTNGVANAASAISGSILHSILDGSKFTVLGGPVSRGINYPNYLGANVGAYPQITSSSPVAVEFNLDTVDSTGRFEISMKGGGQQYRVLIKQPNGTWGAVSANAQRTLPVDGNGYLDLVTLGAAGVYAVRIEMQACVFNGIRTAATDTVSATQARRRRYIVVGDSFTEPTINDSGAVFYGSQGWVQQLAYMTGLDIWSAGSGGTGYLQTNGARPKFYDRLVNDVLAYNPDGVIFAGGINDSSADPAALQAEAQRCFELVKSAGKEVIVVSPFYPKGASGLPQQILAIRDAVKAAAKASGVRFLDLLNYGGIPLFLAADANYSSTLASAYSSGTSVQVTDIPSYFKQANTGKDKWFVKLGSGASQNIREVTNISGTGPYTLSITNALSLPLPAGASVTLAGQSYQTGTGRQGATVGDGNSDRYTGPDTTHPTVAGHANIARCVADMWSRALAGR